MLSVLTLKLYFLPSPLTLKTIELMSKRSLGGGIAWLDGLCSNSYGYAFSANLTNDTTFNFPNPSYTWNLMVCTHEVGHNIGSEHTHACVWADDPSLGFVGPGIDNCAGSCFPPAPPPMVQVRL